MPVFGPLFLLESENRKRRLYSLMDVDNLTRVLLFVNHSSKQVERRREGEREK